MVRYTYIDCRKKITILSDNSQKKDKKRVMISVIKN